MDDMAYSDMHRPSLAPSSDQGSSSSFEKDEPIDIFAKGKGLIEGIFGTPAESMDLFEELL